MNCILQRLIVTLTASGGVLAAGTPTAHAVISDNHTEPVVRDRA